MKKLTLALTLILTSALATGCIITTEEDSSLTIDNASDFVIFDIAVAGSGDLEYGPNLLGNNPLFPDESVTVLLDCDTYDVLVIDEDNVSCELINLDLCFDDALWVLDNFTLNTCAFASKRPAAEANLEMGAERSERMIDAR